LLFAFGVDDRGLSEGRRRDEIADAHALMLCRFDDFLRLFWGVVGEDGPSPHNAHPAAHDRLFLVHVRILTKCIPDERLSRLREHWEATQSFYWGRRRCGTGDHTVETSNLQDRPQLRVTYGEMLATGVVIEVVSSGDNITLLRWDGKNYEIRPQFRDGSTIYQAPFLQPSVFEATRFPCAAEEDGTPAELFWKIVDLFCHYMGFSRKQAVFMTVGVFSSWLPDCGPRPITLCITGLDMDRLMKLFELLHALCRRACSGRAQP